jgi:hypothetical protein
MTAKGGLRAFPVGPFPRPVGAFKVAICGGSNTSIPAVRRQEDFGWSTACAVGFAYESVRSKMVENACGDSSI